MNMSSYSLEIKVISGEGLRVNRRQPAKKHVFVVIRPDSVNAHITNIDSGEKLMVDMPTNSHFITVEVHHKSRSSNKLIGATRIPAKDFVGGYIPVNYLQLLSYRLRDGKGERNGIINLSVRVKVAPENGGYGWRPCTGTVLPGEVNGGVVRVKVAPENCGYGRRPCTGTVVPEEVNARVVRGKVAPENGGYGWRPCTGPVVPGEVNGGVVTGVPVWYGYQA